MFLKWFVIFVLMTSIFCEALEDHEGAKKPYLKALTIASEERDGLRRLLRSTSIYGINMTVLGIGEWVLPDNLDTWLIRNDGLWQKIIITIAEVKKYKDDPNAVILMVDGFDVIFSAGEEEILKKFLDFKANVVFGAEVRGYDGFVEANERYKNLNSGMIIGYAPILYKLLSTSERDKTEPSDQPYYASLYLNDQIRKTYNIKLDHKANLVQNLLFAEDDVALEFSEDDTRLVNKIFNTTPSIIHGNAYFGRLSINAFGNYIARSWNPTHGCMSCHEGKINLEERMTWDYPKVLMGIFIDRRIPFLEEMLRKTAEQKYPKERMFLYVINAISDYDDIVRKWLHAHTNEYFDVKFTSSSESSGIPHAKQAALDLCLKISCDVFFNIDEVVHLDNPSTLQLLISYNRSIIAPVMSQTTKLWSTFWGAIGKRDYERSFDYVDIVIGKKRGIWNVPYITYCYLIWRSTIENPLAELNYESFRQYDKRDPGDMTFCINNLSNETFMYAVSLDDYGYLIGPLKDEQAHFQNELWQVNTNYVEWERRYLHPDFRHNLYKKVVKDVYTFPVFTKRFCEDLMSLLPTEFLNERNQTIFPLENFKFKNEWGQIFTKHIKPTIDSFLRGKHLSEPLRKSFIQKHDPENSLDAAYTAPYLRIALADKDSEGGKCIQPCSFPESPVGWVMIFLDHQPNSWKQSYQYHLISLLDMK